MRKWSFLFLPALLLLLLTGCTEVQRRETDLEGKVVGIADGDTFTLLTDEDKQVKVRLHGVDCPEKGQDFGQVARDKTSALVFGQRVEVDVMNTDRYGRTVGIVYNAAQVCIYEELLRTGLAWHYKDYDDNPEWAALESEARRKKTGLWSRPDPIRPSRFRRR